MPDATTLQLRILTPQRQPLGGTVDIDVKAQTGQIVSLTAADASKDIAISGLPAPPGSYEVRVAPNDGSPVVEQTITLAAGTGNILEIIVNKTAASSSTVTGSLVFDHGLPATAVTVSVYNVGFGGQDTKLGEIKTDTQGNYSFSYAAPGSGAANLQIRVVDPSGKEIPISATNFEAQKAETMNLVVPSSIQPLAAEYDRIAADMRKAIAEIANLSQAQENATRQDLTLLNRSTNWDARLLAFAAMAGQQTGATGLGQDVLYALFRAGLPTDAGLLAGVPSATVQQSLTKAVKAGIVNLTDQQITASISAFQNFSSKTMLATTAPGAVSSFGELLTANLANNPQQQTAFANLFFSQSSAKSGLWTQAATLGIAAQTLDSLRLQGKFLYLTLNNAKLAAKLQQDIGSLQNLAQLAEKDYHQPAAWQATITALAPAGDDKSLAALIPPRYSGPTTADRLLAYAGDMARKVRVSFPTQVTARMIDNKELAVNANTAANAANFLRSASALGYSLGRTPLNGFLSKHASSLPALDDATKQTIKTLHRLYQITPSTESFQTALQLGFTSAFEIALQSKTDFLSKYEEAFPPGEAQMVHGQAQTVSSVTFNALVMAKGMDTAASMYALSPPSADRQAARETLVQAFPSMSALFGNMDFCECEDCRSVLSPAAYFVDLLDMLGKTPPNGGSVPLDVLIGKDGSIPGRRPDLGALPLTCANTNTTMPYIDLVNEIFEYYIAHGNSLDTGAAFDTGSATTADLTAEPQHIIPGVYTSTLKQAVYPLNLPFDLWIETVRGFLAYFKISLAQLLDTMRPADKLELFTSTPATPYYRANILAESLGMSPDEYGVFTGTDPAKWFTLYGSYANSDAASTDLKNAKTLSQKLEVSYQELADLVKTGFLNPSLYSLLFQFERFGIDLDTAFSFTNQPGAPKWTDLSAQDPTRAADFQALLSRLTNQYKQQNVNSTFNAINWLNTVLPANYSQKVLLLADPDTGCNFAGTTFQHADGSAAEPLDFLKLNLLVRLWKKLAWTLDEIDRALQTFFPASLPGFADPSFAAAFNSAWKTALVYIAHLDDLNTRLAPAQGRTALLPLWADIPTKGENPLYAQLFLSPGVVNNDFAFDDPNGQFPVAPGDLTGQQSRLSAHTATIQGVLSLKAADIDAILADAGVAAPAAFTLANLSTCYRYSLLAQCLQLSVADMVALKVMSGLQPFQSLTGFPLNVLSDDILLSQTLAFVKQVTLLQNSGFTVEDLRYLLRHQFDPIGQYRDDANGLITLVQSIASGLDQIQRQNAIPIHLSNLPETVVDQSLSRLLPPAILKGLFTNLTNSQTYTASASSTAALAQADFASAPDVTLSYDAVSQTQTLTFTGLMPDWRKAEIEKLNTNAGLAATLQTLLDGVQQQARDALSKSVADILGVWASMIQYEAVAQGVAEIANPTQLLEQDPSLELSYSQSGQLQWLGYRGVLTEAKMTALTAINNSAVLAGLLTSVQKQALPAYNELIGSLLAMWCSVQTYKATQSGVTSGNQIDAAGFSAAVAQAQQNGTVTPPIPALQITYDPTSQVQTLICQGVLTNAAQTQLAGVVPSTVLSGLLQSVRNQAVAEFQFLSVGSLDAAISDPDPFVAPFVGIDSAKQQKLAKAELVSTFLPLLTIKLSRQLIIQTLSSALGADASLTEALITDPALLNDPSNPGKSLLTTFLTAGRPGVSAIFYASPDLSGAAQAGGVALSCETGDPANNAPGARSCHFEGFLQVDTDGPYRFFAALGNVGAQATFQIEPQPFTSSFPDPLLQATATKDGDEFSRFVQLKGGIAYHFIVNFETVGAGGAKLLIQGETLPKGPLNQIRLYPQQAIDAFTRARVLLSKTLKVLQVTSITQREVGYLAEHSSDFNNFALSALPTQASDDSISKAQLLFAQFLTLIDYTDLRRGPAGGSDGLIDVFQAALQTAPAISPITVLANLTRRDPQVVQDISLALGPEAHFANNVGIRRIWDAMQLLQALRLPVSTLAASTAIVSSSPVSPDAIAVNFKNAVKAQYSAEQWRPIAQSVFDPLRRKKRDALASYLLNTLELENSNQLFEYFLVDPGMEPVVQTSRLRLALSSVQTFIQRCLLNLENANKDQTKNVDASAIPADLWTWMKRYRVWQANREIFLFPENWMEPELRLDKTDLFQALESALLQGDVTRDLVEDAFLDYLKGLDLRARLDIVASYLDQDAGTGQGTLHVLGRTYGVPHKYFYRTYSNGAWSGWQAVTLDIESDHIALAIWRSRLNIFWLTFVSGGQVPAAHSGTGDSVVSMGINTLQSAILSASAQKQVKVQLHWSELVQGKWTNRIATDVAKYEAINVDDDFDPRQVHIHVSKERLIGGEGAVRIHVDFPEVTRFASIGNFSSINISPVSNIPPVNTSGPLSPVQRAQLQRPNHTFRVTSKNCDPDFSSAYYQPPPAMPYDAPQVDATFYAGTMNLTVSLEADIQADGTGITEVQGILNSLQNFEVLVCGNPVVPQFLPPEDPDYQEAGGLVSPFFLKDSSNPGASDQSAFLDERTYFVQPSLTETVIQHWDQWAIPPTPSLAIPLNLLDKIDVAAQVPQPNQNSTNSGDARFAVVPMKDLTDWITRPEVAVSFGGVAIGKDGALQAGIAPSGSSISDRSPLDTLTDGSLQLVGKQGLRLNQIKATRRI